MLTLADGFHKLGFVYWMQILCIECRPSLSITSADHKASPLPLEGEWCFISLDPKVEPSCISRMRHSPHHGALSQSVHPSSCQQSFRGVSGSSKSQYRICSVKQMVLSIGYPQYTYRAWEGDYFQIIPWTEHTLVVGTLSFIVEVSVPILLYEPKWKYWFQKCIHNSSSNTNINKN